MPERRPPNIDLGGYLLGKLEPGERARFEQELAGNPDAQAAAAELRGTVDLLGLAADPYEVPAGLEARTFRALERAIAGEADSRAAAAPARRLPLLRLRMPVRRLAIAGACAMALGAAVFAGTELEGKDSPPGTLELKTALRAPSDRSLTATATVRETGIGRVVSFDSSALPILPQGRLLRAVVRGPRRLVALAQPHLGGHLSPRSQGQVRGHLRRGRPREVPRAGRDQGAGRRRSVPDVPRCAAFAGAATLSRGRKQEPRTGAATGTCVGPPGRATAI